MDPLLWSSIEGHICLITTMYLEHIVMLILSQDGILLSILYHVTQFYKSQKKSDHLAPLLLQIINLFVAVIMDNFDYLTRDWSILGKSNQPLILRARPSTRLPLNSCVCLTVRPSVSQINVFTCIICPSYFGGKILWL